MFYGFFLVGSMLSLLMIFSWCLVIIYAVFIKISLCFTLLSVVQFHLSMLQGLCPSAIMQDVILFRRIVAVPPGFCPFCGVLDVLFDVDDITLCSVYSRKTGPCYIDPCIFFYSSQGSFQASLRSIRYFQLYILCLFFSLTVYSWSS